MVNTISHRRLQLLISVSVPHTKAFQRKVAGALPLGSVKEVVILGNLSIPLVVPRMLSNKV